MAEPTPSPALPSTADAAPYVPVSWAAVAAATVAGLFAFLLLVLGVGAFIYKKPLLMQELLLLPVVALVLSFAARRLIRNSEGTRTGEGLANGAWWTALVLGLGFVAYLFAIDFAVRREAGTEAQQWVGLLREDKFDAAFYRTLPPGARQGLSRTDTYEIQKRYGNVELVSFRNTDLARLARRNPGELTFVPGGVADWSYRPGAIDCNYTGTVTCPEGTFPVVIPMKGVEGVTGEGGGAGRQWAVGWRPGGSFVQQDKVERTSYGWLVLLLELDASGFGKAFVELNNLGPAAHPYLYRAFVVGSADADWIMVARDPALYLFYAIPMGVAFPGQYTNYLTNNFFRREGGTEPDATQKAKFLAAWNEQGIFPAGRRLKGPDGDVPDKEPQLRVTESAVEVLVPIEIPTTNAGGKPETARGKLVVASSDPALLAELRDRKAAAKTEKPTNSLPAEFQKRRYGWRVVRIESDMTGVNLQSGQGGPPGMGGPGGPGGPPGGHAPGGHGG